MAADALDLETFLPYRLNRLADTISRQFSRIYGDRHGLTRPEWRVLATLGQFGTLTATAIGAHSAMHKTKVSRAVAELEARKWLVRDADPADRRLEHLRLTRAGQATYAELVPLMRAEEMRLFSSMTAPERETVMQAIALLERAAALPDRAAAAASDRRSAAAGGDAPERGRRGLRRR